MEAPTWPPNPHTVETAAAEPSRSSVTVCWLLLALVLAGCASVETGPPASVAGRWTGQCYSCPVREFTLALAQGGETLTGTLQAAGRTGLGESPMALLDGRVVGRIVTFRTLGADGVPLEVRLEVARDGQSLIGKGEHRASFGLRFTRRP